MSFLESSVTLIFKSDLVKRSFLLLLLLLRFNFFNVLCVLDYLQERAQGSTLYGFRGGPAGIMKCKYVELTSEYIYPYRNQVIFSLLHILNAVLFLFAEIWRHAIVIV